MFVHFITTATTTTTTVLYSMPHKVVVVDCYFGVPHFLYIHRHTYCYYYYYVMHIDTYYIKIHFLCMYIYNVPTYKESTRQGYKGTRYKTKDDRRKEKKNQSTQNFLKMIYLGYRFSEAINYT